MSSLVVYIQKPPKSTGGSRYLVVVLKRASGRSKVHKPLMLAENVIRRAAAAEEVAGSLLGGFSPQLLELQGPAAEDEVLVPKVDRGTGGPRHRSNWDVEYLWKRAKLSGLLKGLSKRGNKEKTERKKEGRKDRKT